MGLANIVFAPFILLLILARVVFSNSGTDDQLQKDSEFAFVSVTTDEWYRSPESIAKRQWTPYARLLFREYNELPHDFDER